MFSCSVVSYFLQSHGLQPTRFLCPWTSPGKNTAMGCHFLLRGIFPPSSASAVLAGRLFTTESPGMQAPLFLLDATEISSSSTCLLDDYHSLFCFGMTSLNFWIQLNHSGGWDYNVCWVYAPVCGGGEGVSGSRCGGTGR